MGSGDCNTVNRTMNIVREKCRIFFDDEDISRGLLLQTFLGYIADTLHDEERRPGLIYHTGSPIFDLLLTSFLAISCIAEDTLTPEQIVDMLHPGDLVLYGGTRAQVLERDAHGYLKLISGTQSKQNAPMTIGVPPNLFHRLIPYNGEAVTLDGRGAGRDRSAKSDFLAAVFGKDPAAIAGITASSVIIVCARAFADGFINHIQIRCGTANVSVKELITASYFTEEKEYPYPGNPGKNPPTLKFVNNVSTARTYLYDAAPGSIASAAVLGARQLHVGAYELDDLMDRELLSHAFLSMPIGAEPIDLCMKYDDARIFPCTQDMLLSYSLDEQTEGALGNELSTQTAQIRDKELVPCMALPIVTDEEYRNFRQSIRTLRPHAQEDESLARFVRESYALMNYLSTLPFPLSRVDEVRAYSTVEFPKADEWLIALHDTTAYYGGTIKTHITSIWNILESAYTALEQESPKEMLFEHEVRASLADGKNILILVPKTCYIDLIDTLLPQELARHPNLSVKKCSTPIPNESYDTVLYLGTAGTRDRPIPSRMISPRIAVLLYPHEYGIYEYQKRIHEQKETYLTEHAAVSCELTEPEAGENSADGEEMNEIEIFMDALLKASALKNMPTADTGTPKATIVRIAYTDDGDRIFFTRYYKAYVLDCETLELKEKAVDDIRSGDLLLFTKNNDETKDIVDEILDKLSESDQRLNDLLEKSTYWKDCLIRYKGDHCLSFEDLSARMKALGTEREPATVRAWLMPESHIVGPREEEVFFTVALLCDDATMLAAPEVFHAACDQIRRLRMEILKHIGRCMLRAYREDQNEDSPIGEIVAAAVDRLSQPVTVTQLVTAPAHTEIPTNYINRPIAM